MDDTAPCAGRTAHTDVVLSSSTWLHQLSELCSDHGIHPP
jgi:hypothetical protein